MDHGAAGGQDGQSFAGFFITYPGEVPHLVIGRADTGVGESGLQADLAGFHFPPSPVDQGFATAFEPDQGEGSGSLRPDHGKGGGGPHPPGVGYVVGLEEWAGRRIRKPTPTIAFLGSYHLVVRGSPKRFDVLDFGGFFQS